MYSPNKSYVVWCHECWFSDDWDASEYGQEYDPSRPFFDQFEELNRKVPKASLLHVNSVNSEYINISADNKDCYMIIESSNNEDSVHCYWIQQCKACIDTSFSHQTELSYESDDCYNSYQLRYSKGCHDSRDSYFLLDCRDSTNCIGCVNLRSKQYHIFNKPVSKQEYEIFLKNARLDTWSGVEKLRQQFLDFLKTQPRKFAEIVNAPGSTGNYIKNAKNCTSCFHCYDAEDARYGVHVWRNAKDCMDVDTAGRGAERVYNSINAGLEVANQICSMACWSSTFMEYSKYCMKSNNCFGSARKRKKNYCILNKQYDKNTYEKLRNEIVEKMKQRGEYGEFFPAALSAFGYNETPAEEQFQRSKEKAIALGFNWEEYPRGTYGKETVLWDTTPDAISDFKTIGIEKEIFACLTCKRNYLIIQREYEFYKRMQIPLPRFCPQCRHERRLTARGPNRLWKRQCMCDYAVFKNSSTHPHHKEGRCLNEFETSYAPDRPEIVYCEQCYQAEVI